MAKSCFSDLYINSKQSAIYVIDFRMKAHIIIQIQISNIRRKAQIAHNL